MTMVIFGYSDERKIRGDELVLLMEEILYQSRLVAYPVIYRVLYIPGAGFLPWADMAIKIL